MNIIRRNPNLAVTIYVHQQPPIHSPHQVGVQAVGAKPDVCCSLQAIQLIKACAVVHMQDWLRRTMPAWGLSGLQPPPQMLRGRLFLPGCQAGG